MTKFYKLLFFSTLILSTMISISSYSWMGMWIGLEINVLSMIPMLINQKNKTSSESTMKYFITQAIASTGIMIAIITLMWQSSFSSKLIKEMPALIMNSGFLMKMGMAPFHFWFPEVLEGLSWLNSTIMLTWQKITPMVLFMYNVEFSLFLTIVIIMSMMISGLMGINQVSLRKILVYSSINHMGWMLSSMMVSQAIWMIYFIVYSLTTINITMILNFTNTFYTPQMMLIWNFNPLIKLFFSMNFLSLAGMPPFIGFLPKWMIIQTLVQNQLYFITMILIVMTMIMVYVYLMVIMSSMIYTSITPMWNFPSTMKFKKIFSMMNFIMVTSMIMVTMILNTL
uniref:NADH-ubiquinone oxidoreductase chain 2 n=1 Tax=Diaphanes pectinealis TaxID=370597 RepID=A0A5C0PY22_9COLE|nr:NADH dehydrogenase subunit 2 [Diaphanes pectinealis]QEJ81656.1 NADH dehydrogenase subunit 2 [Diaphanes pectinealis]